MLYKFLNPIIQIFNSNNLYDNFSIFSLDENGKRNYLKKKFF